jgi:outer membrane protein OmpA-like peptidoglycan-associated protein
MEALKTGLFSVLGIALALGGCQTPRGGPVARGSAACEDQAAQIYFEPASAEVTREGRAVIRAAAHAARSCAVKKVSVMGLADAAGDPAANLELSKRRAQSVTAALAAEGLPDAEFDLSAAGQAGAVNANGDARLLRRRADVILRLAPR